LRQDIVARQDLLSIYPWGHIAFTKPRSDEISNGLVVVGVAYEYLARFSVIHDKFQNSVAPIGYIELAGISKLIVDLAGQFASAALASSR